jgi:heme iron utilization protein
MNYDQKSLLLSLMKSSKTASLGTCKENQPYVSLTPYSCKENFTEFYIHISKLAVHTKNITDNSKVSLMISQSEDTNTNPLSLARVTLTGNALEVGRADINYNSIKENYLKKYPTAEMLFNLDDFHIYKIEIEQGRYVAGFANTYNLTKQSLESLEK